MVSAPTITRKHPTKSAPSTPTDVVVITRAEYERFREAARLVEAASSVLGEAQP